MSRHFTCPDTSGGDRCTRSDPHGPADMHQRGAHVWGYRDPAIPEWRRRRAAKDFTGLAR